ncbi:hypothetical protein [Parasediminibacterium sp. JCM 36343]|uniref:hypothetical protein n=1 Tax=Parasediminibacterium sp. JCM 36343 TaxID=3374279 RepID=UPI00397BBE84
MEERKYNSMRYQIILLAVVIVIILLFNIRANKFSIQLRNNHIILCGKILEMRAGKGINAIYSFYYQGKKYEFNESSPETTYNNYKKGNNTLLIVVEKENPNNHKILSDDDDYLRYFVKPQDTVNIRCE